MVSVLVAMLLILVLAAVVVVYVAYPHRGADVPSVPWVGDALRRGVDALPTIDNQRAQALDGDGDRRPAGEAESLGRP